jgi:DNA-binding transcriptional ArsR family regulator
MENQQRVVEVSDKFKALSHPHRLSIVRELMDHASNVTGIQQQLGIPQPSVSAHLARLRTAGIISGCRHGQEIEYSVVDEDTRGIVQSMFQ